MQLSVDQYNEIYGTDIKEFTPIEFSDYITYLMDQVKLNSSNEDIFTDIKKLV
jgi:hypothetical protein